MTLHTHRITVTELKQSTYTVGGRCRDSRRGEEGGRKGGKEGVVKVEGGGAFLNYHSGVRAWFRYAGY
jgi:hypothetical protein